MDVSDTKNLTEWYDIVPNPQNEDDEQQAFHIKQGKFHDESIGSFSKYI